DPQTNTWSTGPDMPAGGVGYRAVTGSDGRIYVVGKNITEIFDPVTQTWSTGAGFPFVGGANIFGAALGDDGQIYAPANLGVGRYDAITNSWVRVSATPPPSTATIPIIGASFAKGLDGHFYSAGGYGGQFNNYGVGTAFDFDLGAGTVNSAPSMANGRF